MRTPKYGSTMRKLAGKTIDAKRKRYECPGCGKEKVQRDGYAQWVCRSCGRRFAGGAYALNTEAGEIALRNLMEYQSVS